MVALPVVSGDEAIRVFRQIGFVLDHYRGSHAILCHHDGRHLSVRGHKELKPGTLRGLIKDFGLTVEEFIDLLR